MEPTSEISHFLSETLELRNIELQQYILKLVETNRIHEIRHFIPQFKYESVIKFFKVKTKEKMETIPLRVMDLKVIDEDIVSKILQRFCLPIVQTEKYSSELTENESKYRIQNLRTSDTFKCHRNLPIYKIINQIINNLELAKVLIIESPTGSGKSTQIPKNLLNHYNRILVSVPRRIAATTLFSRVSDEIQIDNHNFDIVGYQVRFESKIYIYNLLILFYNLLSKTYITY